MLESRLKQLLRTPLAVQTRLDAIGQEVDAIVTELVELDVLPRDLHHSEAQIEILRDFELSQVRSVTLRWISLARCEVRIEQFPLFRLSFKLGRLLELLLQGEDAAAATTWKSVDWLAAALEIPPHDGQRGVVHNLVHRLRNAFARRGIPRELIATEDGRVRFLMRASPPEEGCAGK